MIKDGDKTCAAIINLEQHQASLQSSVFIKVAFRMFDSVTWR